MSKVPRPGAPVARSGAIVQNAGWEAHPEQDRLHRMHCDLRAPTRFRPLRGRAAARFAIAFALLALVVACPAGAVVRPVSQRAPVLHGNPDNAYTLFYGDDHVFGLEVPRGWVADDSSGLGSRLRVVLYPRGQHWKDAPVVMYESVLHQQRRSPLSFQQMIDQDVQQFRAHAPKGTVKPDAPIRTHKGLAGEVRLFSPDGGAPLEAVVYLPGKGLVVMLVLQAQRPAGLSENLAAFRAMAQTFELIGTDVQTPTHNTNNPR